MNNILAQFVTLFILTSIARALRVTPNSPCASACVGNGSGQSNTSGSDIVCTDSGFSKTKVGQKFASCINCLQNSTFSNADMNDLESFIYNIRFAVATCLFNLTSPTIPISSEVCLPSCNPLQYILIDGLESSNPTQFSYCSAGGGIFLGDSQIKCKSCLQFVAGQTTIGNFVSTLHVGCIQQLSDQNFICIEGSLFSRTSTEPCNSIPKQNGVGVLKSLYMVFFCLMVLVLLVLS